MRRMHALFAILAMSLVALIARPASAFAPKNGFNTLHTESDGSPVVQIGELCKLDQIFKAYGPMYKQATGDDLTFRVIRAANPTHTIPVCLVKGDGAMKINRASEKVWENCPADQQSIYLIAGINDAIHIPIVKPAGIIPLTPSTTAEPGLSMKVDVDALQRDLVVFQKDSVCFKNNTCLLNEVFKRELLPKPEPVAAQASPAPVPAIEPRDDSLKTYTLAGMMLVFALTSLAFFAQWRGAAYQLTMKDRVIENLKDSTHDQIKKLKEQEQAAWAKVDAANAVTAKVQATLSDIETEKTAMETLRTQMLRVGRDERKLKLRDEATIRELFWAINTSYADQAQTVIPVNPTTLRVGVVKSDTELESLRLTLKNVARNERDLNIRDDMPTQDVFIAIKRSYDGEARGLRDALEKAMDDVGTDKISLEQAYAEVRSLGTKLERAQNDLKICETKLEEASASRQSMLEGFRTMKLDLAAAEQTTAAAIENRNVAERSERALKQALGEYAMALQAVTLYERRLLEMQKKIEESSDLLVVLEKQRNEYESLGNQPLLASTKRSITEVNERISKILQDREALQEQTNIKRIECQALELKLGFSFSNEAISKEIGTYRAEAANELASASAVRDTLEFQLEQLERDLEAERIRLTEVEAIKKDLEERLAAKERELAMREGAVQSLFTEVLTFCDMDPEADVERIHTAGGPAFLMDQMRIRMTQDLRDEHERLQKDFEELAKEFATSTRVVEERNAEILELCRDLDVLRENAVIGAGDQRSDSDSGVRMMIPTPEDLLRHGLADDPKQAMDYALAMLNALPEGSAFIVDSTEDLIKLNKLAQVPIQLPKDVTTLYEPDKLNDYMCQQSISRNRDLFADFRLHSVARFLDINNAYLKGVKMDRRLTMLGIPPQSSLPTNRS